MDFREKYLKYKNKYLALKSQMGGDLNEYKSGFTEVYYLKCDTTDRKTPAHYCNCPGFVPPCETVNNFTLCVLCNHAKVAHDKLQFSNISTTLCSTKK
jgi:hypothetical protein